jgi:hypothetical protein
MVWRYCNSESVVDLDERSIARRRPRIAVERVVMARRDACPFCGLTQGRGARISRGNLVHRKCGFSLRRKTVDTTSESRLGKVHPQLAAKVRAAAVALAAQGTFFTVAQGLRTYAEQDALYAQGRTAPGHIVTNARGGYSNHNFGCAVDCYPFLSGPKGAINWSANSPQFRAMISALEVQELLWGGSWKSIPDAPHFQLTSVPVTPTDADRAAFASGGLKAVWAMYP